MTPGHPTIPPPGQPPLPPEPSTAPPPPTAETTRVVRYYLFSGPIVDGQTKVAEARRYATYYIGWEAYVCCGDNILTMLDFVAQSVDESESWWQIVDIAARVIVYSSYDPRPRH